LGPDLSVAIKQGKVARALEEVGLRDKADRYVGGELPGGLHLRGLSGGEKRRLSLVKPSEGPSAFSKQRKHSI
jgi:ATP-binding cassette subfamily G (WHITE) protein 2